MESVTTLHSAVRLRDDLLFADLDKGEAAVLSLNDGVYYGLNEVGARTWHLLEERKSLMEIRELLLQEFSTEPERLTGDLVELVEKLVKLGLVEISPDATA